MARSSPNVFTIDPGGDFVAEFVSALLTGKIIGTDFAGDPLVLADLTIHVPTRRMGSLIERAFAAAWHPRPVALPKVRPLAEPEDADEAPSDLPGGGLALVDPGLADPGLADPGRAKRIVEPFRRRFLLLPEIEVWQQTLAARRDRPARAATEAAALAEALALAAALGRLIDEMAIEGVPLSRLASAEPAGFDAAQHDEYWALSRDFLRLAAEFWPHHLAASGEIDRMAHRLAAIEAEARRLSAEDGRHPVIVLGSTGSVAATVKLMRAVSRLENGAVILPGLDLRLDSEADQLGWHRVGAEVSSIATRFAHPQANLKQALAEIGLPREAVRRLGQDEPRRAARNRLISEALRPAETAWRWRQTRASFPAALASDGMTLIEAADEREEGLAIALLMRETLQTPGARVGFVTADRALATRVKSELRRWAIEVEDSAGTRLSETPAGTFLRLALRAASCDSPAVMALLRHPFARFGFAGGEFRQLADALELAVLRGRRFKAGLPLRQRVEAALADPERRDSPAAQRLAPAILDALPGFAAILDRALEPFTRPEPVPIAALAADLRAFLVDATHDAEAGAVIAAGTDFMALDTLLTELAEAAPDRLLAGHRLGDLLEPLMVERTLPPAGDGHPRAIILGLLEARLVPVERLILGGMSEGRFPPAAESDPFLNRAMRLALGLAPPERRIGQSAHDFTMLAGHPDLVLTRPKRSGSAPGIASRFLKRLEAFLGKETWSALLARGEAVLKLARRLDAPGPYAPAPPPAVVPQVPRLPARLSITEIETLRRDPYAVYAKHLLGLTPLEPLAPVLDARDRGSLLHAVLEEFAGNPPTDPEAAAMHLRDLGAARFRLLADEPELQRFWWHAFERLIPGFVAFDQQQRAAGHTVLPEQRARLTLALPGGEPMLLTGKADRIEIDRAGRLILLDYKTGTPPSAAQVVSGRSPQLTITAALARRGAFAAVAAGSEIAVLSYLPIGGRLPAKLAPITGSKQDTRSIGAIAEADWQRLLDDLQAYADGERAWRSRIAKFRTGEQGDYDHLARFAEWSRSGGAAEDAEDGAEEVP